MRNKFAAWLTLQKLCALIKSLDVNNEKSNALNNMWVPQMHNALAVTAVALAAHPLA